MALYHSFVMLAVKIRKYSFKTSRSGENNHWLEDAVINRDDYECLYSSVRFSKLSNNDDLLPEMKPSTPWSTLLQLRAASEAVSIYPDVIEVNLLG